MKAINKILIVAMIIFVFVGSFSITFAETEMQTDVEQLENSDAAQTLKEAKEGISGKLQKYVDDYGSYPYGVAAYVLNTLRIYSIPFCFVGIAIGAIYQYMLGIRKLDVRDKGFALIITFVTILLICQVLPLIFAIVVNGWRG